jgi:hypothetical protein
METATIKSLNKYYAINAEINLINFENPNLKILIHEISSFIKKLGDQVELSIWNNYCLTLKRLMFDLATFPIEPEHLITEDFLQETFRIIKLCEVSFPEFKSPLTRIVGKLEFYRTENNQFLDWIIEKCNEINNKQICICVLYLKHIELIKKLFNKRGLTPNNNLCIVKPTELRKLRYFDYIICCGAIKLFSENAFRNYEYIWRSAKAENLYFLSYDWIKCEFNPTSVFDSSYSLPHLNINKSTIKSNDPLRYQPDELSRIPKVEVDDVDFSPIEIIRSTAHSDREVTYEAICECRAVLLEDNAFIYKEIDRSSRIVEFAPEANVKTVANKDLQGGMFLVVRTEGSGDSIAAVADMLFGETASEIRLKQSLWKSAFRENLCKYSTAYEASKALESLGAPTSNEVNVRNWQRSDTIKPLRIEDFAAILQFSGISNNLLDDYWENARRIDLMHKRAGKEISKLLLKMINASNRDDLEKNGRIDVNLTGVTGQLSVIGISTVISGTFRVSSYHLDSIFYN